MSFTIEQAKDLLARRDERFMACDVDAYLDLWAEKCTIEGPDHLITGHDELRKSIESAWLVWNPLLMRALNVSVSGNLMHHEFASVWERRGQVERRLVTGISVAEVDRSGRWVWLREYFDPATARRNSILLHSDVVELMKDVLQFNDAD